MKTLCDRRLDEACDRLFAAQPLMASQAADGNSAAFHSLAARLVAETAPDTSLESIYAALFNRTVRPKDAPGADEKYWDIASAAFGLGVTCGQSIRRVMQARDGVDNQL